MIRAIFLVNAIATAFGPAFDGSAANAAGKPIVQTYDWHVSLDADGHVTTLRAPKSVTESVRDPLEKAIHTWAFEPGRVDGRPASTETTLSVTVSFVPDADDRYAIRIDDARTGGAIDAALSGKHPPKMPLDAWHAGLVARVVVKAEYDENGKIGTVELQPDQGINASKSLGAATIAAVRAWTVNPECVDGHGIASSVMVPICYTVTAGSKPPPFDACDWTPAGSHSKIGNGSAYALAPASSLKSDVIGQTL